MKLPALLIAAYAVVSAQQPAGADASAVAVRTGALDELSAQMEGLSRRVSRSVVQIFSTGYALSDSRDSGSNAALVVRQRASGSGVVVSADGYIVTNAHVVANAGKVRVRIAGEPSGNSETGTQPAEKVLDARLVGIDQDTDIAVVKIDRTGLAPLAVGDSDTLRQGQLVMAFGNPLGLENSVSMGVVSSIARQIKPDDAMVYIQTDAPINPGNSGGPLVDTDGRVMGINTFILSQSGGSEGLGFAIPSNIIKSVYAQLRKEGHVHRSEIGVYPQTITPEMATGLALSRDWGVILADVEPGGPGDVAGLKAGDIVLSLDGKSMANARQMEVNLYRDPVGAKITLQVLRGATPQTIQVVTVERRGDPQRFADLVDPVKNLVRRLGILGIDIDQNVAALLPDLRIHYGVVVAARTGDAPYTGDSLDLGDVIHSVNATPVISVASLRQAIDALKRTDPLVLQVERNGHLMYVTLERE